MNLGECGLTESSTPLEKLVMWAIQARTMKFLQQGQEMEVALRNAAIEVTGVADMLERSSESE